MKVNDFEEAYAILKNYKGKNNQILYYQYKVQRTNYSLAEFDVTYILNNFDFEPYEINKTVKIAKDYGEILKKKYELDFLPEKIRITRVIGEMGESLHCYVQYRKSVEPSLMYVKKRYILNQLIDNTKYIEVNVDFEKYDNITKENGTILKKTQKDGIEFLLKNKKCILADGMGMGKTRQAVIAAMETGAKKILIICPASLKSTWKREILVYNDESEVSVINGSEWNTNSRFTVVNYDILANFYKIPTDIVYEDVLNEKGEKFEIKAKDLFAQAISHETDHLNGEVFIDKIIPGTLEILTSENKD